MAKGVGSGPSELVWRHEAGISQSPQRHPAAGSDGEPGDAAVVEAHPEPALRRKLESPDTHTHTNTHMKPNIQAGTFHIFQNHPKASIIEDTST